MAAHPEARHAPLTAAAAALARRKATAYVWKEVFRRRISAHESLGTADRQMHVVLDIGANVGVFAAWAAHEHHPDRIICYEASPVTFRYLQKNLALLATHYPKTRFEAVNAAVSNSDGQELTLFHRATCTRASTLLDAGRAKGGEPHKVRSVTLANELARRSLRDVDLLKVDVEGHFMEVLQGIGAADYQNIRSIVLECDWLPETGRTVAEPVSERHGYAVCD